LAAWTIHVTGGRWGFFLALATIVIWAALGPICHYSDDWQLVINTGTTIVTFLMVFLIQNAQNRESKALHLKLDELIRAVHRARTDLIDIENLGEEQLDRIARRYTKLAAKRRDRTEPRSNSRPPT
jgi:low affinity Fe/Cu permease